jgi:hypothetical protein
LSNDSSRGAKHVAREVSAGYGELALVEMPAIDLLTSLGWSFKNRCAETFGELSSEGRESESQVILTHRLLSVPLALNPGLPADAWSTHRLPEIDVQGRVAILAPRLGTCSDAAVLSESSDRTTFHIPEYGTCHGVEASGSGGAAQASGSRSAELDLRRSGRACT